MAIDLLNLQPTVVTRDLKSKFILVAAPFKYGKTTLMTQIEGALILSFEPGLHARAGVFAQTVTKWSEVQAITRQLAKPEIREKYTCICWDTFSIAADLCKSYICAEAGVKSLSDVAYGKLYDEYENELSKTLLKIANLGYGMIFACHVETKIAKFKDKEIEVVSPDLDKRALKVVNSLCDIIGIGMTDYDEDGNPVKMFQTAESLYYKAGNRFPDFPPLIPFSYQSIVNNLSEAIEKEGQRSGLIVDAQDEAQFSTARPYFAILDEAAQLWELLLDQNPSNNNVILGFTNEIFGSPIRLSEIPKDQTDKFEQVVAKMRGLLI